MMSGGKWVHCAIYTRVSTEAGLDQAFNSLDAQYDAAAAYIRSQAHAHWSLMRTRYDDGGFSGGSTDRPALQRLLADVTADRIKVIVVYKVDRLTRSLADFAKLVELFDAHGVSFVSVTQQFNTTTSMGRLTLNMLLSFAQFEREVTSERIRDKIAASKRKGLWVGGPLPLGYQLADGKIMIIPEEADTVRDIFCRYLALGSLRLLLSDLAASGITTKRRRLSSGRATGGIPFTRGPLDYLLRNRFYVGEVAYKGEIFPGQQPAILERGLFDAVQTKLSEQRAHQITVRHASGALLLGRIFDDHGNRMTSSHARRNGVRYRYYVSTPLIQGQPDRAAPLGRAAAPEIERLVVSAVRQRLNKTDRDLPAISVVQGRTAHASQDSHSPERSDRDLVADHVARVVVRPGCLEVHIQAAPASRNKTPPRSEQSDAEADQNAFNIDEDPTVTLEPIIVVHVPWAKKPNRQPREILPPASLSPYLDKRPIRAETRVKLVTAIAKGRCWLAELLAGITDVATIAARERCSIRQVNMTISLAFLSPTLVQAAIDGRLPRGIGVAALRDAPAEWSDQHARLGLAP